MMTAETVNQLPASHEELVDLIRDVYQEQKDAAGKKVLSVQQIRQEFLKLPGEECRQYELAVSGFARDWADSIIKRRKDTDPEPPILQLLPKHGDQLVYGSEEEKIAFAAFAVAINYERLQKNPKEEGELLETYREFFGKTRQVSSSIQKNEHIYFFHLDVLYRMDMAVGNTDEFLMDLLKDAKTNSLNLTENYGGHHAFAETTALVFETASSQLREKLENSSVKWLEDAKLSVIKALAQDDGYAKFYCTYGRIQALLGELDEAIKNVNTAIALEKNTRSDYSLRIGQYSGYYQQFRAQQKLQIQEAALVEQMREMKQSMTAQAQEMKQSIAEQAQEMKQTMEAQEKESMAKNMEFLGLFSGIVSFTIGSLTITGAIAEQSIKNAAGLIVVLLGALMCVFAAFGMILHGFHQVKRDAKTQRFERSFIYRHLIVFLLGILVVVGGIVFCMY